MSERARTFWLINGPTEQAGARTRGKTRKIKMKHRNHRRVRRHRNPESRRERSSASRLGWRRRRHHNPVRHRRHHRNPVGGLGVALVAGVAAYVAVKGGAKLVERVLPVSLAKYSDVLSTGVAAAIVGLAGVKLLNARDMKGAIGAAASIPVAEALLNMTSLGASLGLEKIIMLPPPAHPGGMSARLSGPYTSGVGLEAELRAQLEDEFVSSV